jgi:F-type H+-transporting ATPase subunit b
MLLEKLREFLSEPEFWVAVGFAIFVGILIYVGVPKMIIASLDDRAKRIKTELDEARRLKEEAQGLLAEYQRKQAQAEGEAQAIIESAKAEAERIAAEAKTKMEEFVVRRTKMAETKIAQAEAQAVADVRAAAAEAAVTAAETILTASVKGKVADDLLAKGIGDVKTKLN